MPRFRFRSLALFSSLAAVVLLVPRAAAVTLTLEEALAAVDEASFTVLLSREAVLQALEVRRQQKAGLLPNVSLDATQRRSRSASFGENLTRGGVNDRFDAGLGARLDVLNPQRIASYAAARLGVSVAELDVDVTRQTVLATVAQTYFQHLRNLSRTTVLDANITRARALLDLARRQVDAQVATQIDVTRAEAQVATSEQARLQHETFLQSSELALKRLLALDLMDTLSLAPFDVRRVEATPFVASLEETAFEKRVDYLRAQRLLEQNELEVRAARYGRLPAASVSGSTGIASERAFDGDDARVWSTAVSVSMPVFDGSRVRALTGLALSRQRAQELRVQELRLRIGAEVRLATQDARSRFAQVAVAERSKALAEDELRLAQVRFENGVADNREIIDAQNNLAVASDNLVEAVYQYNLSRVELARVTGDVRSILAEQDN